MSDIFNHSLDAFESWGDHSLSGDPYSHKITLPYNPLAYHMKIDLKIVNEVGKATEVKFLNLPTFIIPTSWIRNKNDNIYVWQKGFITKLKELKEENL